MTPEEREIVKAATSLARSNQDAHLLILRLLPLRSGGDPCGVDRHAIEYALPEAIEFLRRSDKVGLASHLEGLKDSLLDASELSSCGNCDCC